MHRGTEEKIIYEIVDDILELEDTIEEITSKKSNEPNEKQREELAALKIDQEQNNQVIRNIQSNLAETVEDYNQNIKKKQLDISKLQRSVIDFESQLRTLAVASATTSPTNIYRMSYEKIEDIINTKKTNDELQLLEQEYANIESNHLSLQETIKETLNHQNEIKENLQMMKEEKNMIQYDLINLISQKESLEEMAKLKLHTMKTGEKTLSVTVPNVMPSIASMDLFRYEISQVDLTKISREISEALIDLNEDVLTRTYLFNMIKNESSDYLRNSNWKRTANDFLSVLTIKGINILQSVATIKELTEENLHAYFKAIFKVNYYEKIIRAKIGFVSKEYKAIKKEMVKEVNEIQAALSKLNVKKEEIENRIKEKKYKMNVLVDNKAKNGIGLTREEKAFLQLNDRINEQNALKQDIQQEINELNNHLEAAKYEANDKEKEMVRLNEGIQKKVEKIENDIKENYLKANEEIVELRRLIAEKFKIIKTQLKIYKQQYGNNLDLYNKLVEGINLTLRMSSALKPSYSTLMMSHDMDNETQNQQMISAYRLKNSSRVNPFSQSNRSGKTKSFISPQQMNRTPQKSTYNQSYYEKKLPHDLNELLYSHKDNNINLDETNDNNHHYINLKYSHRKNNSQIPIMSPTRNKHQHSRSINNTSSLWDDERSKLEKTIQKLKSSISKNEELMDKEIIKEKVKPIMKSTYCYYRFIEGNCFRESKFNPLEHSVNDKAFGFTKANVYLNQKLSSISIKQSSGVSKEIPIDTIDSTIVTNVMKYIIKIFRSHKRAQVKKINIEDFVKREEFNDIPLNFNERVKAAVNQMFNMTIKLGLNQRIEFVFFTYDDLKIWLNGLAFIIKNKTEIYKIRSLMKN